MVNKNLFKNSLNSLKSYNKNFLFLLFFIVLITLTRNVLEYYGSHKIYFGLTLTHLLNTYAYVLLMIFAEGSILNWLLKGNKKQLRRLIQEGSILVFVLFLIIPIFNIVFNYNFLKLSSFYNFRFLPYPHYGPVGIHVAFILVLFYFPFWLKKIYNLNYLSIFKKTFFLYTIHYIIYYQLTMYFCFVFLKSKGFDFLKTTNVWSITFLIPVLVLFPFFIKKYSINLKKEKHLKITYIFILSILLVSIALIFMVTPSTSLFYKWKNSLTGQEDSSWDFYFMNLKDKNLRSYYGLLLSFDMPNKNVQPFLFKLVNNETEIVSFSDYFSTNLNKNNVKFSAEDALIFLIEHNDTRLRLKTESLNRTFWWNHDTNRKSASQFNDMKGHEDFSTFNLSLRRGDQFFDLTGFGIHERATIRKLELSWDTEYWFYFFIDGYYGIYIQYDDYIDGIVFDNNSQKERITSFEIFEETKNTLIKIETESILFRFWLNQEIQINPYDDLFGQEFKAHVYSKTKKSSRNIVHKIYTLDSGIISTKKHKTIKVRDGYFQLETLD